MTVSADLRTYGGANSQTLRITAYNDQNLAISNTLVLTPGSTTLTTYSGTLTFTNSSDHDVYIKAYSGNNSALGISGMSFNYMSWEEDSLPTLSGIAVSTAPTKTSYTTGEYFDPTGLIITRTYSDSTSNTYTYSGHTSEFAFTPSISTALTTSNTLVTITYGGKSCNQEITVNDAQKTLSSISISTAPTKTSYTVDEFFNPVGLIITRNYSDASSDTYTYANHTSEFSFTPSLNTPLTTQDTFVTISYGGRTCQQSITVESSGSGSGGGEEGSKRIVSQENSDFYESGCIYLDGDETTGTAACDAFTATQAKQTGSNAIVYNYDEIRIYTNHRFTISPNEGYTITSIVITAKTNDYASAVGGSSLSNCTKSVSSNVVTLIPTNGDNDIYFVQSAKTFIKYIDVVFEYAGSGSVDPVTYITASTSKTFYVGDTISKSDLSVKDSNNSTISLENYEFFNDGYQFRYSDAIGGGDSTQKTFTNAIRYESYTCNLVVNVLRKSESK